MRVIVRLPRAPVPAVSRPLAVLGGVAVACAVLYALVWMVMAL